MCMFCRALFVLFLLAIVLKLSVIRFTDSDYPSVKCWADYDFSLKTMKTKVLAVLDIHLHVMACSLLVQHVVSEAP